MAMREEIQCRLEQLRNDKRGTTAIAMAILTPIMIAGLAFGTEYSYFEGKKRNIQNTADTAAFAAATQVRSGVSEDEIKAAAKFIAKEGGFDDTKGTIDVQWPPTSGDYAGDNWAVQVTLVQNVERRFSKVYNQTRLSIPATSVAFVQLGRPACVLSLHPSASESINVSGGTDVTLSGCDLAANSIASDAIDMNGSAKLTADCISAVGGTDTTNNLNITCPDPIEGAPVTRDPYAERPEPDITTMTCASNGEKQKITRSNGTGNPKPSSDPTFNKMYCGSGTETVQANINLSAGVYVFNGGNWKINSTANLSGSDVTLFFTGGASIDIAGNATVDISAPTSGDYAGLVLYFADGNTAQPKINGGSNFSMVGAIYGPDADIEFTGNTTGSGPGECTQVIGSTVTFSGNSDFDTDCSNSGTTEIRVAQSIRVVE